MKHKPLKINRDDHAASIKINRFLSHLLTAFMLQEKSNLTVVCIGSDRSTGDSLGPLVGERLQKISSTYELVWGTLKDPVHAVNLSEKINHIHKCKKDPFIIAIDASLGKYSDVGKIEIGKGAIQPGKAVNKNLPEVGDIYIRGVVNVGGFMEQVVLQSTRLYLVMDMAHVISRGLLPVLMKTEGTETHGRTTNPLSKKNIATSSPVKAD